MSERPRVRTGTGPETIRAVKQALRDGVVPGTYVSGGALVCMEQVSGDLSTGAADEDSPLPVAASLLTPASLAGLFAEHAYVYRMRARKGESGDAERDEDRPEQVHGGGL